MAAAAAAPAAMEVDEVVAGSAAAKVLAPQATANGPAPSSAAPLSLFVLRTIKSMQSQHGLRHGDYLRYRQYCTRKLRRLYKSLKFLHGRGKYQKKTLKPADVTDVRHLHILLMNAERGWAYGMELKQLAGGPTPQQRWHLVKRFAKGARWAEQLATMCAAKADSRSVLEAEAYHSWMLGNVLLERENDLESALSKTVYDQLSTVGSAEDSSLFRQRSEELAPLIKYCEYKLGRAGKGGDLSQLRTIGDETDDAGTTDLLQSKLEEVMGQMRSQQAAAMADIEWRGRKLPVRKDQTRVCVLKGEELVTEARKATTLEKKMSLYDKAFIAFSDARRHINDDMTEASSAGASSDARAELQALSSAVAGMLLERTIERNLLLVRVARSKLQRQNVLLTSVGEEKLEERSKDERSRDRDKDKAKPQDLVRLYDILLQNIADLSETALGDTGAKAYAEECAARKAAFTAERCFYIGLSYAVENQYAEAVALFSRAEERAQTAIALLKQHRSSDQQSISDVEELLNRCRAHRAFSHAQGCAQLAHSKDTVHKGVSQMSLKDKSGADATQEKPRLLVDALQEYIAASANPQQGEPLIAQLPPPFQAVPHRPIVLDTAFNAIQYPSLAHRTKKADKKTGLFGWFRR
eukprot:jgi/Chlat1/692/Chrsp104S00017